MKLIFLHGLGQTAASWKEVQDLLVDHPSEALELFPVGVGSYQEAKKRIAKYLSEEKKPFVLICVSLGATLALELSSYDVAKSSRFGFVRLSSETSRQYLV